MIVMMVMIANLPVISVRLFEKTGQRDIVDEAVIL